MDGERTLNWGDVNLARAPDFPSSSSLHNPEMIPLSTPSVSALWREEFGTSAPFSSDCESDQLFEGCLSTSMELTSKITEAGNFCNDNQQKQSSMIQTLTIKVIDIIEGESAGLLRAYETSIASGNETTKISHHIAALKREELRLDEQRDKLLEDEKRVREARKKRESQELGRD